MSAIRSRNHLKPSPRARRLRPVMERLEDRQLLATFGNWTPIGPAPVVDPSNHNAPLEAGRITVAAADPGDPNVMFVGGDDGGVWKTSDWLDPSPTWVPLTDNQTSLRVTGYRVLELAPSDHNVIYAAVSGPGGGILKSGDGGATWNLLGGATLGDALFSSLAISPTDPRTVYAGAWAAGGSPGGLYKTTDGGETWTNITQAIHSGSATDVAIDPAQPSTLYVGLVGGANGGSTNGIYESTNGGSSWTRLSNGILVGSAIGATIRLALAPSDPKTLYATVFDPSLGDAPGGLPHRYRTIDGGASWTALTSLPGADEARTNHVLLSVDPGNARIVYANGDHTVYQSTDGGQTWQSVFGEDPVGGYFDATGAFVLTSDQGIQRWAGAGTSFTDEFGNLQVTQFYTLTLDPTDPNVAYGIAQDQSYAMKYSGAPTWNFVGGDETGKVIVDSADPKRLYVYDPLNPTSFIWRSDDAGATWVAQGSGIPTTLNGFNLAYTSQWAFVADPANSHRLIVGTDHICETTNDGNSWTDISPMGFGQNVLVTGLAIAPSQGNTIYAATSDGHLYVTQNDGAVWQERDSGLPAAQVRFIAASPSNPGRVFLVPCPGAWSNNLSGPSHVWMSTDGGMSWSDVRGDLPAGADTTSLAVDWRYSTPVLYVGALNGVYRSTDLRDWSPYTTGLPNAIVTDLEFLPQFNLLAAATGGRSAFEILVAGPPAVTITSTAGTSTYGQPVSFTASVAPSGAGSPAPTGSIQFQVDGSNLGPAVPLVNGSATSINTTALSAGTHTITAVYLGDTVYGPASASLTQIINPAAGGTPMPTPTGTPTPDPTPGSPPTPAPIAPAPAPPPAGSPHRKKGHRVVSKPTSHQHPVRVPHKHGPARHGKPAGKRVVPLRFSDGMSFSGETTPQRVKDPPEGEIGREGEIGVASPLRNPAARPGRVRCNDSSGYRV